MAVLVIIGLFFPLFSCHGIMYSYCDFAMLGFYICFTTENILSSLLEKTDGARHTKDHCEGWETL